MLLQSNVQEKMGSKNDSEHFHDASGTEEDNGKDISDLLTSFKKNENAEGELEIDTEENLQVEDIDPLDGGLEDEGNWPDDIELDDDDILGDIGDDEIGDPDLAELDNEVNKKEEKEVFVPPTRSNDPLKQITSSSLIPAHHVAIGDFKQALDLLKKQVGLSNPRPLRSIFAFIHSNSKISLPSLPKFPSINITLRTTDGGKPAGIINLDFLKKMFKEGSTNTTKGNFKQALISFQKCIQHAVLSVALTLNEEKEIKKLVNNCVEYILAMKIELKRRDKILTTTEIQNLELA